MAEAEGTTPVSTEKASIPEVEAEATAPPANSAPEGKEADAAPPAASSAPEGKAAEAAVPAESSAPAPTVGADGKLLVGDGLPMDDAVINALFSAIEDEKVEEVEQLVRRHGFGLSKAGFNILMYAAANRRGAVTVQMLLAKYSVPINERSTGKVFNFPWNEEYVLDGRVDENYAEDITAFDEGLTAVQLAALSGSVHSFRQLVAAGGSLGPPTKGGRSVQQLIAARHEAGGADSKKALVKALLEEGETKEGEVAEQKEAESATPAAAEMKASETSESESKPEQNVKRPGLIWSREQEDAAGIEQEFILPKDDDAKAPSVTIHMPTEEKRPVFEFEVQGQKGAIPQVGFGTAAGPGYEHVKLALATGYRHIDAALLYGNQVEVGQAIKDSGVRREDIFITSKVSFFPGKDVWMYNANNLKGDEPASIDLVLNQLGVEYVDLLLVHNACSNVAEYDASCVPHFFELFNLFKSKDAIPMTIAGGENLRELVFNARRERAAKAKNDQAWKDARAMRERTWRAMEAALKQGKCKYIGVANYPHELMIEMKEYATVMPAVNQVEFHPRFSSPRLQQTCKELGVVMTGYGSGNSVLIENSPTVAGIAQRIGRSPLQVVLRWTLQHGVSVIPAAKSQGHMKENLNVFDFELSPDDMTLLDSMNQDHCYYWDPKPTVDMVTK